MSNCACGCGKPTGGKWSRGHNRRGVPPTNKKGDYRVWSGRAWVYQPTHARATNSSGYVKRAVLVAEDLLGRPLLPEEDVHHLDGNKMNDRPENLMVLTHAAHARLHMEARHAS